MAFPVIRTAIPQRRYQLCDFSLVVLCEIESSDGIEYKYLMGIIPQGKEHPELFISVEKVPAGGQQMCLHAEQNNQTLQGGGPWRDLDSFVEDALQIAAKLLSIDLNEYEPFRLQ